MNKRLLLPLLLLSSPLPAADLLSLDGEYRVDLWHNLEGGLQQGGTWLDDLGLNLSLDGEALGWSGFSAYLSGLSNNSNTFSDRYVGDLQGVSNIDTGAAIRLYEAWLQQGWGSGSVRAGLYDLNSEFDTIDGGALFLNSSFGIGPDFAQSGANGPSIFPVTGLALRLEQSLGETLLMRTAVLEGTAGDPAHPANTTIRLDDGEGWLGVAELDGRPGGWWVAGVTAPAPNASTARAAVITPAATPLLNMVWMPLSARLAAGCSSGPALPMSSLMPSASIWGPALTTTSSLAIGRPAPWGWPSLMPASATTTVPVVTTTMPRPASNSPSYNRSATG